MSQRINHRREGRRYQDNGPRWESHTPSAGCNTTHVARARASWRTLGRRAERRTGRKGSASVRCSGRGRELPEPGVYLDDVGEWQSGERDEDVG